MFWVVVAVDDDLTQSIVHMWVMAALTHQMLQEWVQQLQPAETPLTNVEQPMLGTHAQRHNIGML